MSKQDRKCVLEWIVPPLLGLMKTATQSDLTHTQRINIGAMIVSVFVEKADAHRLVASLMHHNKQSTVPGQTVFAFPKTRTMESE